ncbi:acyl-CoA dehydrogenase [Pacificimonas flava]|uniref:Acyl-CoA dehydrogenase n=2 Tax=Pacificimonas TaxID=1960290 RepID=A0A219B209_9SPHN|nr:MULTISPECIES: acyl-CoA dehydrogenase family protein [Pacificimonas]MBZ6378207.1 acyl-CoA dehydrogenase family protein [Pacificimonas aurantium]OWV32166.1 acyl-CoA dehydrogenase [Pacificimonas flava]
MALYLTEDQEMLRDSAEGFVREKAPVAHMRKLRDGDDKTGYDPALWKDFAEMGFSSILMSEDDGGLGLGHVEAGVVLEEVGKNLTPSPLLSTGIAAVAALKEGGAHHREKWFPKIAAGDAVAALAIDETAKHDPAMTRMSAERSGNGFKLSGRKQFVVHGHVADLLIVAARTGGSAGETDGITLFAVEKGAAKMSADARRLTDASLASVVEFDGVEVDADAVIGEVDQGWGPLSAMLAAGRAGASAEMLGVGQGAADISYTYLKERTQFGVPIGSFQALQHRAAHLYAELEVARAAVLKAQQLLDEQPDGTKAYRAVHVAKAMTGWTTTLAVQEGVQFHAGVGMTDEYDIGLYMKRGRVLSELFGDANYHANLLARESGY